MRIKIGLPIQYNVPQEHYRVKRLYIILRLHVEICGKHVFFLEKTSTDTITITALIVIENDPRSLILLFVIRI